MKLNILIIAAFLTACQVPLKRPGCFSGDVSKNSELEYMDDTRDKLLEDWDNQGATYFSDFETGHQHKMWRDRVWIPEADPWRKSPKKER